jgi:hypothetical protein
MVIAGELTLSRGVEDGHHLIDKSSRQARVL